MSYNDVSSADGFLEAVYVSSELTSWVALSDADKGIYLERSHEILLGHQDYSLSGDEATDAVKKGEAYLAVSLVGAVGDRAQARAGGVSSFSLGELSETYSSYQDPVRQRNAVDWELPQLARSVLRDYEARQFSQVVSLK